MESMEITRLDASNFTENSLDDFSRFQEVTQVYRLIDGQLQLVPLTFTEDWPQARKGAGDSARNAHRLRCGGKRRSGRRYHAASGA